MSGYEDLIDLAVVGGAALVIPTAIGQWQRAWRLVAVTTTGALLVAPSPAAGLLALPWAIVALAGLAGVARRTLERPVRTWTPDLLGPLAMWGWAVVAGLFLVDSCVGRGWFGYAEPITRLTVVHFIYAGVGTTAMASAAFVDRRRAWRAGGLAIVVAAPPMVAVGFVTGWWAFEVGGPIVMAMGAYLVGAANLIDGWSRRTRWSGRVLVISGVSVLVPMVLAVAWALAPHTGGPALSIPDMVRLHGGGQALGFVGCGLAGRWLAQRDALDAPPRRLDGAQPGPARCDVEVTR